MEHDKILHLGAGIATFFVASLFTTPENALYAAIAVGFAKEVYDYTSGTGTPEFLDFAVTAAGGGLGFNVHWAF